MNTNEIEEYLKKLKEFEKDLNTGNVDDDFVSQLNKLMGSLSNDISSEVNGINNELEKFGVKIPSLLVNIKKLHPNAVIPTYSKEGDAGMDLTSVSIEHTEDYISYKTGLSFEIPSGYVGLIFPRSSNSKKDLLLTNSVGVIDSGYRGEVELRFKPILNNTRLLIYDVGDRIGQIMIIPYPTIEFIETENLSNSERGEGGFGSTGL
jgi:dUTP pyrophosphatase